jgi:hypothetical protein
MPLCVCVDEGGGTASVMQFLFAAPLCASFFTVSGACVRESENFEKEVGEKWWDVGGGGAALN